MKRTLILSGNAYQAPSLELYSAPVEKGFANSVDGSGILDWEKDDDSLEF